MRVGPLTVGLPDPDDQLGVEGLAQPLRVDQLHGAVLQTALDVGEDGLVPRVQHQLEDHKGVTDKRSPGEDGI